MPAVYLPRCDFCGRNCYSDTVVSINCKELNQSEIFRAKMCDKCKENVVLLLKLFRNLNKKEESIYDDYLNRR